VNNDSATYSLRRYVFMKIPFYFAYSAHGVTIPFPSLKIGWRRRQKLFFSSSPLYASESAVIERHVFSFLQAFGRRPARFMFAIASREEDVFIVK